MTRIELTDGEIKVIEQQLKGEFDPFDPDCPEADKLSMNSVMEKANALMDELEAWEESGDDVVKWFYDKFKEQNNE